MIKKWQSCLVIVTILFLVVSCVVKENSNTDILKIDTIDNLSSLDVLDYLYGEWLQEDYVNKLMKYKSSIKAGKTRVNPLWFKIKKEEDALLLSSGHNFTMGGGVGRVIGFEIEENKYRLKFDSDHYPVYIQLISSVNVILDIQNEYNTPQQMIKADSGIENFISRIILVGNYMSDTNESCFFSEDGLARLPGMRKEFNYSLAVDWGEDGFRDETNKKTYAFEWKENKLYIYDQESVESDFFSITDDPIILTKVE